MPARRQAQGQDRDAGEDEKGARHSPAADLLAEERRREEDGDDNARLAHGGDGGG